MDSHNSKLHLAISESRKATDYLQRFDHIASSISASTDDSGSLGGLSFTLAPTFLAPAALVALGSLILLPGM